MSILCPTTCGFAKVAVYELFKEKLIANAGENSKIHKSREIQHRFDRWHQHFVGYNGNFNVRYDAFVKYGAKISSAMKNLNKRRSMDRELVLKIFSMEKWRELSPVNKGQHELFECKGCLDDPSFKSALSSFMISNHIMFDKVAKENGIATTKTSKKIDEEINDNGGDKKRVRSADSVIKIVQDRVPASTLKMYDRAMAKKVVNEINEINKNTVVTRTFGGN